MKMTNEAVEMLCERATEVAAFLKIVANEHRLLLLCHLRKGEASVGELVSLCGLSQSSVSQHLSKMREGGILVTRRKGTTIHYSLSNGQVEALIMFLCERFSGLEASG
jgi:DNA-binding transcriptional ArsR family regulator